MCTIEPRVIMAIEMSKTGKREGSENKGVFSRLYSYFPMPIGINIFRRT